MSTPSAQPRQSTIGEAPAVVGLSLVIPMYAVERYLPELLDSITAQVPGRYALQCVFVDDGSPDRSAQLVEQWIDDAKPAGVAATLVRQPNAGVSAARNRGIAATTNDWIAFPDSDDALDPRYCTEVAEFLLTRGDAATIVATNLVKYIEAEDRLLDNHSLSFKFRGGAKNVRLATAPHYLQMHAASTFFRRQDIEDSGIRFIEGLHASEDALFVAAVLASRADPVLGVVPAAVFRYRKRASGDSAVDLYRTRTSTYFDRFDNGYLPMLARLADERGRVPEWFQNQLLYELKWLFLAEQKASTKAVLLSAEQQQAFLRRVSEALSYVDDRLILDYRVTPIPAEIQHVLLALKGSSRPQPRLYPAESDTGGRAVQVRYLFAGEPPEEEFTVRGRVVEPLQVSIRTPDYFGQTAARERRVRLEAANRVTVRLNGEAHEIRLGWLEARLIAFDEQELRRPLPGSLLARGLRALRRFAGRAKRVARTRGARWAGLLRPSSLPHRRRSPTPGSSPGATADSGC